MLNLFWIQFLVCSWSTIYQSWLYLKPTYLAGTSQNFRVNWAETSQYIKLVSAIERFYCSCFNICKTSYGTMKVGKIFIHQFTEYVKILLTWYNNNTSFYKISCNLIINVIRLLKSYTIKNKICFTKAIFAI